MDAKAQEARIQRAREQLRAEVRAAIAKARGYNVPFDFVVNDTLDELNLAPRRRRPRLRIGGLNMKHLAQAFTALMDEIRGMNRDNSCLAAFGDGEIAQMIADALDTLSPDGELRAEVVSVLANAFSEVSEALP